MLLPGVRARTIVIPHGDVAGKGFFQLLVIDWFDHVSVHSRFETTRPIIVACAVRTDP
jgi:hypothetical protein